MRIHYGESMTKVSYYLPLAKAAEENGYVGFSIPDSLIYPEQSDTQYTYTDDGGRTFLENKPFIETFTLATAVGIATERLELVTNVLKMPVRPPLYTAKLAASIAVLTDNRLVLGAGTSVWPEDYAAMGVPYEKRGARFDECIEIIRGLTAGGYFEHHGQFYDLPSVKLNPVPSKPIPILIGGHSDPALRRGARNDGHMFTGGDLDMLTERTAKLFAFRKEQGTEGRPFRVFTTAFGYPSRDLIARYADLGITDLVVAFRNVYAVEEDAQPLNEKLDIMKRFADEVIAKL